MNRIVLPRFEVRIWVPALLILSILGYTPAPATSSNDSDLAGKLDREIESAFCESDYGIGRRRRQGPGARLCEGLWRDESRDKL